MSTADVSRGRELEDSGRPRLFVFVPALVRPRALLETLSAHLSGVEMEVFGRVADFVSAVEGLAPSAALAPGASLREMGLTPALKGSWRGEVDEPYVVITHQRQMRLDEIGSSRLGAVSIVDRRKMPELLKALLGLSQVPTVCRVLMMADLLPLLDLDLADALVVPERMVAELQQITRVELRVLRPAPARMARSSVAFLKQKDAPRLRQQLMSMPAASLRHLGLDGWKGGT